MAAGVANDRYSPQRSDQEALKGVVVHGIGEPFLSPLFCSRWPAARSTSASPVAVPPSDGRWRWRRVSACPHRRPQSPPQSSSSSRSMPQPSVSAPSVSQRLPHCRQPPSPPPTGGAAQSTTVSVPRRRSPDRQQPPTGRSPGIGRRTAASASVAARHRPRWSSSLN